MAIELTEQGLELITRFCSSIKSSGLVGRLEETRDFDSEVIAVLLSQSERFVNRDMPIAFTSLPNMAQHAATPQKNNLHNNPLLLEYLIGVLKEFTATTRYSTEKLADEIKTFTNNGAYKKIHSLLPSSIKDRNATEVVRSLYGWHIKPSLAAGDIILKHMNQDRLSEDPTFRTDLNLFHSVFDTVYKRLTTKHPYSFIERQFDQRCSDILSKINEEHVNKNYQHNTNSLERDIIINLYSAAYLVHYIAHAQIMQHPYIYSHRDNISKPQEPHQDERVARLIGILSKAINSIPTKPKY